MSAKPCSRLWEVEAARDGRLSPTELASALRHRALCAECSEEQRELAELGQRIRQSRLPSTDEMRLRRGRQRLLASWNDRLLAPLAPRSRTLAVGAVALGTLALGATLFVVSRPRPKPLPLVQVDARAGASWTERQTPTTYRVALRDGVARFAIRSHEQQAIFIDLPDGVIEDRGTVFEVEVRGAHTERVSVEQGGVVVRLNGQASFELSAGEAWTAPAPPSVAAPSVVDTPPTGGGTPARARPAQHRAAGAPSALPPVFDTAEDDAYLHIVDLLRNGHAQTASAQAKQYLARFPNGFRRPEVAKIAARIAEQSHEPR